MAALAAALTLVGYSVNDTIVVFDRIREEIIKRRDEDLVGVINYSLNVTLSRTVITSLLTLFSAIGILIFGGGALREISMYLVSGIIVGTYSTIFIASPVALAWSDMQTKWEKARKK
jgi:preprotein translocase SecF subunit